MGTQDKAVWAVIKRIIEMREELARKREAENAEMRMLLNGIGMHADCGGRGCHHRG